MAERLSGRVLVTGAAGGIGSAVGRRLVDRGVEVLAADLDPAGAPGTPLVLDVTDHATVDRVVADLGPLDGLVLAHGITALGPAADVPMAAAARVVEVNLLGSMAVARAALGGLAARRGRIAVLSSVAGFAPLVHRTAYAASKHGVHGWFDSLRAEVVGTGISVTIVAPSFVATGIESRATHRSAGGAGAWSTTGEVLSADDVAAAVVDGLDRRRRLVLPSRTARAAGVGSRAVPTTYERLMRRRIGGRRPGGPSGAGGGS
ncbi:MAG: SDR family NAD(P)-dependent oxidoreductase [Acidimicrobiia bacterium]